MKPFRLARLALLASVVTFSALSLPACGPGGSAKSANVVAKDMPDGESWLGVYFHPTFGYLHLVEEDQNVIGKWQRTDKSAWGRLSGTKTGNVLHFTWEEHKYGLVGPSATVKGRGYFVYKKPGDIAELDGEYGLDDSEVGSDWHQVKQLRMMPDLNSITGDTPGGSGTPSGGFDEGPPPPK